MIICITVHKSGINRKEEKTCIDIVFLTYFVYDTILEFFFLIKIGTLISTIRNGHKLHNLENVNREILVQGQITSTILYICSYYFLPQR